MRRPFPIVRTERLELRPYSARDVEPLHRLYTEPQLRRWLVDDAVLDRSWVEEEVASTRASWRRLGWGQLGLRIPDRHALIGFVGLRPFGGRELPELLYAVHPDYQGRGLASEAVSAVVRYAFEILGFQRVTASTELPNRRSQRLLRRLGMSLAFDGGMVRGTLERWEWVADSSPFALRWDNASG